jgi:hypothetical protein
MLPSKEPFLASDPKGWSLGHARRILRERGPAKAVAQRTIPTKGPNI